MLKLCYILITILAITIARANVPETITYQGRLYDNGVEANGTYILQFAIFDAETNGNLLWPMTGYEIHTVVIENGYYTVALGQGDVPMPIGASVFNSGETWLELKVNATVIPRVKIHSVPYSMQAQKLAGVNPAAEGDIMRWDGTNWKAVSFRNFYRDTDGDGYGDKFKPYSGFEAPEGFVDNKYDCDDNNAAIHPPFTYYQDSDNDGYGNPAASIVSNLCSPPSGYVTNTNDCDDTNPSLPFYATYYPDGDGDGFGDMYRGISGLFCEPLEGYITTGGDCHDGSIYFHPGAVEIKDYMDNDCDGAVDEDW